MLLEKSPSFSLNWSKEFGEEVEVGGIFVSSSEANKLQLLIITIIVKYIFQLLS